MIAPLDNIPARPARVIRGPEIAGSVVLVDGLPGCGKTLMAPIIASLARMELMQPAFIVEFVCELNFLNRLPDDAATVLIRMITDLQLYNSLMSRETNFRFSDLSGVWSNPNPLRYLLRLALPGDAAAIDRIAREKPILELFTHYMLAKGHPIFDALGERIRMVEVVRHPLYMIKQQFKYMHRWGKDPRDFAVCFTYGDQVLPWWAHQCEEDYVRGGLMDRVILMIDRCQQLVAQNLERLSPAQSALIMIVPFERFVVDPWPYIRRLEPFLGTTVTKMTPRTMRKQRVPRRRYADGIGRSIYREYGWEPPLPGSDEATEFQRRRQFAAQHASPTSMEILDRLCAEYETRYLSGETICER